MQNKKLVAVAVAFAMQTYYVPAIAADNNDDDKDCPANISLLSKEERSKLSATCLAALNEKDNHWGWVAGGMAALAAGVAIGIDNNGGDSHHHNSSPVPPDDGGDVTPTPPDDGGDVTPTPPDDGGDVTPTPPDDDDDKDTSVISFSNRVTINKGADTLQFDDIKLDNGDHLGPATLSYAEESDQWQLTTQDGKTLDVANWRITDNNAAIIEGAQANGLYWKYDSRGYLILADNNTQVIAKDGSTNTTDRGLNINGKNKTGVIISGDSTTNTLSGDSSVTDGATGIVISGDNTNNTIAGQSTVNGATGALISGEGTDTHISGGIDVTGGGTGLVIDGDNIKIDNAGISNISGEGSTGSIINGNNANVINDGEMNVTGGGTGGKIIGDNTTVANKGDSTVSGEGSTALIVDGNGTTITSEGTQDITDGATGAYIKGDDADAIMSGDIAVSGGGTAMVIDGNNSRLTQTGDLLVTNGAMGIITYGEGNTLTNTGNTTVHDANSIGFIVSGKGSTLSNKGDVNVSQQGIGIEITGDDAQIKNRGNIYTTDSGTTGILIDGNNSQFTNNGSLNVTTSSTGAEINGTRDTVILEGEVNVKAVSDDGIDTPDGLRFANGNGFIGVKISADNTQEQHGVVLIDGNVDVVSERNNPNDWPANPGENPAYGRDLAGVMVNGNFNDVNITGEVNVSATPYHADLASGVSSKGTQYQDNVTGLIISGEDNTIVIDGGVQVSSSQTTNDWTAVPAVTGIDVSGTNNQVTLNGASFITATSASNNNITFANISDGASMNISEDASLDIDTHLSSPVAAQVNTKGSINLSDQATLTNNGDIYGHYESLYYGTIINAMDSVFINDTLGSINIDFSQSLTTYPMLLSVVSSDNSQIVNKGTIAITNSDFASIEDTGIISSAAISTAYTPIQFSVIEGYGNTTVSNEGQILTSGGNTWGIIGTDSSTISNTGTITHTGVWKDKNGNNLNCSPSIGSCFVALGGGIVTKGASTGTNSGTINVVNAGIGMWANGSGATAINQGEINLTSDESVGADTPYLIGMAALDGGVVVNDTTGVININANYGQAFYSDGTGYIINNGAINVDGSPIADDDTAHMGTAPTDEEWLQTLAGSGDSITKTSDTGFFTTETLANYGTVTLNGDVDVNGWLYNESGATLTVNGNLNITTSSGGTENHGTLNADTITTAHSLFNEADGSITTDLLTLNGNTTFFNDGEFTGSIAATSYQQEIVNTGNMTVAEDGKSLVSGSFYFYNQEGATLTNSGNAVEGGENTIINMTRTSDSISQVNSGTITATNGYSAITTANASNNPVWIWNTETGVINGINPDAPLINLSRGYNFGNEGTINVQGDNAVAISGGTSSYEINLVNSGTINVGTEQGKADGTNGTGLIGIQGNGKATTINNTADGVINVYADDSYAFGGQTKAIINNGEINLLCETGCGIYAPSTTGTQHNADGTADIAIPDAATAPAQGNVPTPPADPNAPQMLSNYIVGTNADGSSGTLKANNLVIGDNVKVGTGFTAGTADTTVVVDNAFTGSNIQGAENITSTSVVWNAQGSTDADGNVDVTMTKNAYTSVATDSSVNSVAQALDAGYTNNELYNSLNVGTTTELNSALKQVSGSQATTAFREARILSNRFNMLADAAPKIKDGLAFNVVAKGDPRAELGNDTQYDMLALRQTLDVTASQNLTLEYGIARLDGSGSQKAGDNGLTGGYSQFFGLKHSMTFDDGLAWNNALRYDAHSLDSSRSVSYGDVNKVADSSARQQYMEFRSEGAKTFSLLGDALKVTPHAGVKFRHTMEDGYKERSAGDFNLSMNAGSETAVDSIVGLKLDYAGENGWSATATVEGGPNLSYAKSQRTASLQGAAGQQFSVDDGQKGGGMNGLATVGVKYSAKDSSLNLDAYQWKEDGISDKGFMLNFKKTFR
ncbi:BigA/YdbA N-terminal beta-barrel domain-containing protein [Citrobacter freundii]|uniref:BigA/YdbA N-terminal beta-barrel domain-containing protein n=1 Tax=Citrobacter freundii TaxID=546 RepID=UPI00383BF0BF